MPMIDTTTICFAPAAAPVRCRFRAEAVKNAVAASWSGEGPVAVSMMVSASASAASRPSPLTTSTPSERHSDHIVSALLEDLDEVRSDSASGARHGNLLAPVFGL